MEQLIQLKLAPGIFTEETDRGAESRWKDGSNVRWKNGLPQKIGGWDEVDLTENSTGDTTAVDAYALSGIPRNTHTWSALDGNDIIAVGTNTKLYLIVGDEVFDITPIRLEATITNPFTTVNTDETVTVDHVAHGAQEGDTVIVSNSSAVGGITPDGSYIITVVSPDQYTIEFASAATSSAGPGGGSVKLEYELSPGSSANGLAFGYGACTYGTGFWGTTRSACSTMIIPLRIWSLDNWGEDLIASPSGGAVYTWDRTGGFNSRATIIENAPAINQRVMVSPENRQLLCFGTQDAVSELSDPLFIEWSDNEDFDTFDIETDNNAGNFRIDSGSEIITATRTRGGQLIWTNEAVHFMQSTGGSDIYSIKEMGSGTTIAGPNAMIDINGVVYYMGVDNFYTFDGVLRVLPCEVWSAVFENFNVAQRAMVFCGQNRQFGEIWWFYPPTGQTENQKAVVYNYRDKVWYLATIERSAWADFDSVYEAPFGFDNDGSLWKHEQGLDETAADGVTEAAITAFVESEDIEIGDGDSLMHIGKLVPDFQTLTGTAHILLKGRRYPGSAQVTKPSSGTYDVTSGTTKKSVRIRARQISLRVTMDTIGDDFRMGSWRAESRADGRR